jgi:hypothetical protein
MGREFKNDDLKAKVIIPDTITGAHYMAWNAAYFGPDKADGVLRALLGTLAVIEGGFFAEDGVQCSVKDRGLDTPLPVLVWMQSVVTPCVTEALTIPKASTPPAAPPLTGPSTEAETETTEKRPSS